MSDIKEIFKAYKASDYRDPEFETMLNEVKRELGASEDEVVEILSEVWNKGLLEQLVASASDFSPSRSMRDVPFLLFKTASQTPEFTYIEALVTSLNDAVARGATQDIQQITKNINAAANAPNTEYKRALYEVIESARSPTETIDNMPVMQAIKSADSAVFDDLKKIHQYGKTQGFPSPGAAANYVHRPGSVNEVADLVSELKKPSPDPKAVERFKQVAKAEVGLWGKDADAARQLSNTLGEREMRAMLAKLNLSQAEEGKLLNNFLQNQGPRMAKLIEREKGFLGSLSRVFSATKGGSAMDRLRDAAKVGHTAGGTTLKAVYLIPRMLWKIPRIGKVLGAAAGLAQTAWMGSKIADFFGDDDADNGNNAAPASGEAAAGQSPGSSTLTSDPALTGNLHQNMRTILKRTFGPR